VEQKESVIEEVNHNLARYKTLAAIAHDDNETLALFLDKCLEIKVMRKNGALDLRRINNDENRRYIEGICKRYGIRCT
jgi:hypothetical protein